MDRLLRTPKSESVFLPVKDQVCMLMKRVFLFPHQQIIQVTFCIVSMPIACLLEKKKQNVMEGESHSAPGRKVNMSGPPLWVGCTCWWHFVNTDVDLSPHGRRDRKWT